MSAMSWQPKLNGCVLLDEKRGFSFKRLEVLRGKTSGYFK